MNDHSEDTKFAFPRGSNSPERQNNKPPRRRTDSNKIWLTVGCVLIAILAGVAVALYLMTDKNGSTTDDDYEDGNRYERPLRKVSDDRLNEPRADMISEENALAEEEAEGQLTAGKPGRLFGQGTNGDASISMELTADKNGNLSGTYWNVLYNLQFSLSGRMLTDGTLDMTLTQVKDHTQTPLLLTTSDGFNYSGRWGKNQKPVSIRLSSSLRSDNVMNSAPIETWHIKGPDGQSVLNADLCIGQNGQQHTLWYLDQGAWNSMKLRQTADGYKVYNFADNPIADITRTGDRTAVLTHDGMTFEMTRK
ncbi:MAG: hypothetical protein NC402_01025 [Prevotella sp.]|nr:hypothetical protein [Prevotella sp.]MCM1074389.1 hypothetical protein [Ruminococcus sp.]